MGIYHIANGTSSGSATLVLTVGTGQAGPTYQAPGSGDLVYITAGDGQGNSITSVVDNHGQAYAPAVSSLLAGSQQAYIFALIPGTTPVTGDTFTITFAASGQNFAAVKGCDGVASATADKTNGGKNSASTAVSSGSLGTLGQAAELVVACAQSGNAGGAPSSITPGTPITLNISTHGYHVETDELVNSTTGPTMTETIVSASWAAAIASFKLTAPSVNTTSLPGGSVSTAYSQNLTASGGVTSRSWAVTSGSLPAGLSLSGNTISGTPTAAGTSSFTVTVTDAAGQTASKALSITVTSGALTITTSPTLPNGTIGTAYTQALAASGGTGTLHWSLASGTMPAGLSLKTTSGGTSVHNAGSTIAGVNNLATLKGWIDSWNGAAGSNPNLGIYPLTAQKIYHSTVGSFPTPATLAQADVTVQAAVAKGVAMYICYKMTGNGNTNDTSWPGGADKPSNSVITSEANQLIASVKAYAALPGAIVAGVIIYQEMDGSKRGPTGDGLTSQIDQIPYLYYRNYPIFKAALPNIPLICCYINYDATGPNAKAQYFPGPTPTNPLGQELPAPTGFSYTATSASPCVFTASGNTFANGDRVVLTGGGQPGGFLGAAKQMYFVTGVSGSTFSLAATQGGAALASTSTGSGTVTKTGGTYCDGIGIDSYGDTWVKPPPETTSAAQLARVPYSANPTTAPGWADISDYNQLSAGFGWTEAGNSVHGSPSNAEVTYYLSSDSSAGGDPVNSVQAVCAQRVAAGLPNIPFMWYAGYGNSPPGNNVINDPNDYRIPLLAAIDATLVTTTGGGGGKIAGTPTTNGTSTFTLKVKDSATPANTATQTFTLQVGASPPPALVVNTTSLPAGVVGAAYSKQLTASNGVTPRTWALNSGTLPAGLSLSSSGLISGTPTTAGSSTITVKVTDSATPTPATAISGSLTIAVTSTAALTVSTSSLPNASTGSAYTAQLAAQSGTPPYSFWPAAGTPPSWPNAGPTGAYLGQGSMGVSTDADAEAIWTSVTGRPVQARRIYNGVSDFSISAQMTADIANGRRICLTLKPAYNPTSSADLAALGTMMTTLKSAGADVIVTLWHEPFFSGLSSAQYIAMVQYYGPTVRAAFPLAFVTAVSSVNNNSENSYYPGDAWVDMVATDYYEFDYRNGAGTLTTPASPADSAVPPKPFGVWECNDNTVSNFLTGDGATFEGGIQFWTNTSNCTIARTTAQAHSGSASLQITVSASPSGDAIVASFTAAQATTYGIPCTPGDVIPVSSWFRPATTVRNVKAGIEFYNSAGTSLTQLYAPTVSEVSGQWVQSAGTVTAPASAAFYRHRDNVISPAASEVHYMDDPVMWNAAEAQAKQSAFYGYIQSYFAGRLAAGKPNADVLFFNSTGSGGLSAVITQPSDTRIPFLQAMWDGINLLPAGLQMTNAGLISGTVQATAGAYPLGVMATDKASTMGEATASLSITVAAGSLLISTTSLPDGQAGSQYSQPLSASNSSGTLTWAADPATLPPGLSLDPAAGVLTGTPSAPGSFTIAVTVTDATAATASASIPLTIDPAPIVPPGPILPTVKPWRFVIAAPQPAGTYLAEVSQAQKRSVTFRTAPDQYHEATVDIAGDDPAGAFITELQTDLQVMLGGDVLFCGRIGATADQLDGSSHRFQPTALDYREVLRRRSFAYGAGPNFTAPNIDVADICWGIIRNSVIPGDPNGVTGVQAYPGGNLGIARGIGGGGLGITQSIAYNKSQFAGDVITELAQMQPGAFDWDVSPYGAADLRLDLFYPQRGVDRGVVLELGGALVATIQRSTDPSTYANSVLVTGQGSGTTQLSETPTPGSWASLDEDNIGGDPAGRWDAVVGTQISTQAALDAYAAFALQAGQVVTPSYVIQLHPGMWQGVEHIWLGDFVTVRIQSGRLQVNDRLRVAELAFDIDSNGLETLTVTLGQVPFRWEREIPRMLRRLRNLETLL